MARFRKKPIVIEAEQWFPGREVAGVRVVEDPALPRAWCQTLEGGHLVTPGDWIITGIAGEKYPCKPDIFAATYEAVDDADADEEATETPRPGRPESGPMRFAGDWCGVFIRGDHAFFFASALESVLNSQHGANDLNRITERAPLLGLADTLRACDERGDVEGVQEMRSFDDAARRL